MKLLKRGLSCIIVLMYAFGASTFSHMLTMNHPTMEVDMSTSMDHTGHENMDMDTESAQKKCIETCEKIEKFKISSLANAIVIKSIIFNHISFSTPPLETIHTIPLAHYYKTSGPPGEFAFSPLHLAQIESTVLMI